MKGFVKDVSVLNLLPHSSKCPLQYMLCVKLNRWNKVEAYLFLIKTAATTKRG